MTQVRIGNAYSSQLTLTRVRVLLVALFALHHTIYTDLRKRTLQELGIDFAPTSFSVLVTTPLRSWHTRDRIPFVQLCDLNGMMGLQTKKVKAATDWLLQT